MILAAALVLPHDGTDQEAISRARAAEQEAEQTLGPGHPATAMMLRNLALAYAEAGFYERAEAAARQSLTTLEQAFGKWDVSLTPPLNVLTEAYVGQGRYIEARPIALRAVAIGPGAGAHYATALQNLGTVSLCLGRLKEARDYYHRALLAREATLPAGHLYIEVTREALEGVETKLGARR